MDLKKTYFDATNTILAELALLQESGVEFVHYQKVGDKAPLPPGEILSKLTASYKPCKRCASKTPPPVVYGKPSTKTRLAVVVESKAALTPAEDETLRKIIEHENSLSLTPEEVLITLASPECVTTEATTSEEISSCTGHIRKLLKALSPEVVIIMGITVARGVTDETAEAGSVKHYSGIRIMATHSLASIMADKEKKMRLFKDVLAVKALLHK